MTGSKNRKTAPKKSSRVSDPTGQRIPSHGSLKDLFEAAKKARKNSYSPYSGYAVGAALRTRDGRIFTGCNVENCTYGATACAEQVAIQKAVSETGKLEFVEILVVTEAEPPGSPCGICRQVMHEFGPDAKIHVANTSGVFRTVLLKQLLPEPFGPNDLR